MLPSLEAALTSQSESSYALELRRIQVCCWAFHAVAGPLSAARIASRQAAARALDNLRRPDKRRRRLANGGRVLIATPG